MPRLCRLSDEEFYYVKGKALTPNGLANEFISAQLGKLLELPIPDFELAALPRVPGLGHWGDVAAELGSGPLFASKRVLNLMEIDLARSEAVPVQLRRDVAAFDYWIGNADRILTCTGGNPNLFWDVKTDSLVVLDHNLAFDQTYSLEEMLELHIFRHELRAILSSDDLKSHYAATYTSVLTSWQAIIEQIPEEWLYSDSLASMDADVDFAGKRVWLERLCSVDGWGD